ncbi:hypothetical protein L083_2612 [Actinoplanes sp. N902-109]|nr:hypothetical protein L083_2612 [Actinoplanes sp. N902-109]
MPAERGDPSQAVRSATGKCLIRSRTDHRPSRTGEPAGAAAAVIGLRALTGSTAIRRPTG